MTEEIRLEGIVNYINEKLPCDKIEFYYSKSSEIPFSIAYYEKDGKTSCEHYSDLADAINDYRVMRDYFNERNDENN